MSGPSFTRTVANNPRLFLALVAVVGVGAVTMQAVAELVPDSGSLQAGVFVAMALVAAVYVGSTHEPPEAEE
ncbi:hypothetical protein ACFR9U_13335 [Halorientalis brevis]|uniref:Uncharacterized protein n=1 Tax=Halorientalis brevis TaxID=1126241 RepID=A0ABD6CD80_9EURY|nr:hypothetical protein [Halorientalis brevis]